MPGPRVLLPSCLALLLAACGSSPAEPLLDRPAFVAADDVVWAQGETLHVGDRTFPLPGPVATVAPSAYGVIVTVKTAAGVPGQTDRPFLVDEQGTTPLPGSPGDLRISPDGRYAGWIDDRGAGTDGPATAVVVDLRTGETVLSDSSDMAGDRSRQDREDLYGDVEFFFLGFDDTRAYWTVIEGDVERRRADLATGEVEPAARPAEVPGGEQPIGEATDRSHGTDVGIGEDGRPTASRFDGRTGSRSPGGRWCAVRQDLTALPVTDCASGADVTPRYPAPEVVFGGWLGEDSYLVKATAAHPEPFRIGETDDRVTFLAVCTPPAGTCRTVQRLVSPDTVAVPTAYAVP